MSTLEEQREIKVTQTTTALKQKEYFVIRVQTFPTPEEALTWLLAKDEAAD